MKHETICGFQHRNKLVEQLFNQYENDIASKIILLTGPSGCGKSFVANKVVSECHKLSDMCTYVNCGDSFVRSLSITNSGKPKIDTLSFSFGLPFSSVGMDIGLRHEESQYNYIKTLLCSLRHNRFLFCLDGLSTAHSQTKAIIKILLAHCEDLEKTLSAKFFFLFTDTNTDVCMGMVNGTQTITHFNFFPYDDEDILAYLKSKHLEWLVNDTVKQNISQVQKISNGNLALADFLFVDIAFQSNTYFDALENIVKIRLSKLKKDCLSKEICETDMEDIILSSALSLYPFTTAEISSITNRSDNTVADSLDIAKKEAFVDKNSDCFYHFLCPEVKSALEQESIAKRKERLLHYYQYYTQNEQDEYYIRAFYLVKYYEKIPPQAFALLGLSFSGAFCMADNGLSTKIDDMLQKYATSEQKEAFDQLRNFYNMISKSSGEVDASVLHNAYLKLKKADFEIPLKAELSRIYFHYLYRTHSYTNKNLIYLFQECLAYANQKITLTNAATAIKFQSPDETILRLNIIYCIAPYLLDVLNRVEDFTKLYELSLTLSNECNSNSAKGLGQYIQNVFNRKAFLFVNQTQCEPYYERAKHYFSINRIWDEMCLTLVCQAGTDIVIQKYDEAQYLCKEALEIADRYRITLPQPQKLQNNLLLAEFLEKEEQSTNEDDCLTQAKATLDKLKQLLCKKPCSAEFVILTNICSLCLYCGNDREYLEHKSILQTLMHCQDVSDISDSEIDDFYRYYFAWFEIYRMIRDENWEKAECLSKAVRGFIPALFQKQELFWEMKDKAIENLIQKRITISAYDFCNKLVKTNRRENILSRFFLRGLMLSDLQYTSYN